MAKKTFAKYGHVPQILSLSLTWPNLNTFERNEHYLFVTIELNILCNL